MAFVDPVPMMATMSSHKSNCLVPLPLLAASSRQRDAVASYTKVAVSPISRNRGSDCSPVIVKRLSAVESADSIGSRTSMSTVLMNVALRPSLPAASPLMTTDFVGARRIATASPVFVPVNPVGAKSSWSAVGADAIDVTTPRLLAEAVMNMNLVPAAKLTADPPLLDDRTVVRVSVVPFHVPMNTSKSPVARSMMHASVVSLAASTDVNVRSPSTAPRGVAAPVPVTAVVSCTRSARMCVMRCPR